ncbi:hypothetical protein VTK56DRAFT_9813 [Thermocarpiscus australiensis]
MSRNGVFLANLNSGNAVVRTASRALGPTAPSPIVGLAILIVVVIVTPAAVLTFVGAAAISRRDTFSGHRQRSWLRALSDFSTWNQAGNNGVECAAPWANVYVCVEL